ncbi:unnamed protein product, partial [Prunus brigantina]
MDESKISMDQYQSAFVQNVSSMGQSISKKYQSTKVKKPTGFSSGSDSSKRNSFIPVCHFCNKKGHIRPNCFKLRKNSLVLEDRVQSLLKEVAIISNLLKPFHKINSPTKRIWVKKNNETCLVVLNALSVQKSNLWYFDSGCSRHMTGDKSYFCEFSPLSNLGSVTFGDGSKSKILGKGTICAPGIDKLENVLLVENLKSNLISISQLCDQDTCDVHFTRERCTVSNNEGKTFLSGLRSSDNCYYVETNLVSKNAACNLSIDNSMSLWHQRLGHVNLKDLEILPKRKIVRSIPKFLSSSSFGC